MLQIKLVPYSEEAAESERQYIFTENLNMTIEKLEKEHNEVIDVDFFNTNNTSYAVIKYEVEN